MVDYTSARTKLGRANEHLAALEATLSQYLQSSPVGLVSTDRLNDPKVHDVYVKLNTPVPVSLNSITGDCLHNLRGTLDHLAMALAIDDGADPYDRSSIFPMHTDPARFHCSTKFSVGHRDFLEKWQPYQPGLSVLFELHDLDNMDKHRNVIEHKLETLASFEPPSGVIISYPGSLQLRDGAHFAVVTHSDDYDGPTVLPSFNAAICVPRSNRLGFHEVQPLLRSQIAPLVEKILNDAESQFP